MPNEYRNPIAYCAHTKTQGNIYYILFYRDKFPLEPRIVLGLARIYDMINDSEKAVSYFKQALVLDASNVEAIASLGAHFFYNDQVT